MTPTSPILEHFRSRAVDNLHDFLVENLEESLIKTSLRDAQAKRTLAALNSPKSTRNLSQELIQVGVSEEEFLSSVRSCLQHESKVFSRLREIHELLTPYYSFSLEIYEQKLPLDLIPELHSLFERFHIPQASPAFWKEPVASAILTEDPEISRRFFELLPIFAPAFSSTKILSDVVNNFECLKSRCGILSPVKTVDSSLFYVHEYFQPVINHRLSFKDFDVYYTQCNRLQELGVSGKALFDQLQLLNTSLPKTSSKRL